MAKKTVMIGASSYTGNYILPRLLVDWEKQEPDTELVVEIADSEEIFEQVQNGKLEMGLIGSCLESENLETREFLEKDELILIAPSQHPLAAKKEISVEELRGQDFILREPGSGTRMWYRELLNRFGISFDNLNVRAEMGSHRAILTAVEAGGGLALVPKRAAQECLDLGLVAEIKVREWYPLSGSLYMIYPRGDSISPETTEFINFLEVEKRRLAREN